MTLSRKQIKIQSDNLIGAIRYLRTIDQDDDFKHLSYQQIAIPYWLRDNDHLLNELRHLLIDYFLNSKFVNDLPTEKVLAIPYKAKAWINTISVVSDFDQDHNRLLLDRPSIFSSKDNRYYLFDSHFWFDVSNILYTTCKNVTTNVHMAIGDVIVLKSEVVKYRRKDGSEHYGLGQSVLKACGQCYDCSAIKNISIRGYDINSNYDRGDDWVVSINHLDYIPKTKNKVDLRKLHTFNYSVQPSKYTRYYDRVHSELKF